MIGVTALVACNNNGESNNSQTNSLPSLSGVTSSTPVKAAGRPVANYKLAIVTENDSIDAQVTVKGGSATDPQSFTLYPERNSEIILPDDVAWINLTPFYNNNISVTYSPSWEDDRETPAVYNCGVAPFKLNLILILVAY